MSKKITKTKRGFAVTLCQSEWNPCKSGYDKSKRWLAACGHKLADDFAGAIISHSEASALREAARFMGSVPNVTDANLVPVKITTTYQR